MVLGAWRSAALAAGLAATVCACASIWGFQEGGDLPDAAADTEPSPGSDVDGERSNDASDDHEASVAADDAGSTVDVDAPAEAAPIDSGGVACSLASICVPQAPDGGWAGPYAIIEGSGSQLPVLAACPGATYSQLVFDGRGAPVAPQAACTCICAPSGGSCAPPSFTYQSASSGCSACAAPVSLTGSCTVVNAPSSQCRSAGFGSSAAVGVACSPDASTLVTPLAWNSEAHLCALPGAAPTATCAAGEVCAPVAALPVENGTLCVALAGQSPCPPVYYTVARAPYYLGGGGNDTRGCSSCSCGAATGAVCSKATIVTYTDSVCTQFQGTFPAGTACASVQTTRGVGFDGGAPTGASCPATGGQPTGTFAPTAPYTICCNR